MVPKNIAYTSRLPSYQGADSAALEAVQSELKQVEEQQRRLTRLYVSGAMPEDVLPEESVQLSRRRGDLEAKWMSLEAKTASTVDLDRLVEKLPEVATRLRQWVLDADDEDVDLILNALDLRVKASTKEVQIEGVVPVIDSTSDMDLVTIVQTSA